MGSEAILIIDDNALIQKLIRALLAKEGYEVQAASDAGHALSLLQTFRPRLILMDIQLPGTSGLALTRQLRQDPTLKDTVIVAVTAYTSKGDEEKARDAGCDGYIAKPIDTRTLPQILRSYLDGKPAPA